MKTAPLALLAMALSAFAEGADAPKQPDQVILELAHADDVDCALDAKGQPCGDASHWRWSVNGNIVTVPQLRKLLKKHAEAAPDNSGNSHPGLVSANSVLMRVDRLAPYAIVLRAMNRCAAEGLYKIEWSAVSFRERKKAAAEKTPLPEEKPIKAWLPSGDEPVIFFPEPDDPDSKEPPDIFEARVTVTFDAKTGKVATTFKKGDPVADDEALMVKVEAEIARGKKNNIAHVPVLIEASPGTPFSAVEHIVEICVAKKIQPEYVAPIGPDPDEGK